MSDDGLAELLAFLLRERPARVEAPDLPSFWMQTAALRSRFRTPVDRAVASGFVSDRVGYAFAAGYEAALHALVPELPSEAVASFAVTEEGGNHPRSIASRLEPVPGGYVVTGKKRWSTMAPLSDTLVVIAKESDEGERPRLRAVRISKGAPGLTVREMPATPFVPEVPHAEMTLDGVRVAEADVLAGDGYTDYAKPFRTIEDLHVQSAMVGYLCSVAIRHGLPEALAERFVGRVPAVRALAALDPKRAETHVALAGFLSDMREDGVELENHLALLDESERERWQRDRVLMSVAAKAREQRRARAWESVGSR